MKAGFSLRRQHCRLH